MMQNISPKMMEAAESKIIKEVLDDVNLIVISQHGSSGSNLLQSILDNHSDIYMMPIHFQYPLWSEIFADEAELL